MSRKIQIWPSLDPEIHKELTEMAEKEKRKVPDMAAILIELAIKEKKRRRKGGNKEE